jgi:hypothetical protein
MTGKPRIYYKSGRNLAANNLPFFLGWVDFEDENISGRHYKPKIDRSTETYLIGYYGIEGEAATFSATFVRYGLVEITLEEFNTILSQWTGGGEYTPYRWGLALKWETAKSG